MNSRCAKDEDKYYYLIFYYILITEKIMSSQQNEIIKTISIAKDKKSENENAKEKSKSIENKLKELMQKIPTNKKVTILLTVDSADGRGDIEHFIAFALKIHALYPEINLIGMVGILGINDAACQQLIQFLKDSKNIFFKCYVNVNKTGCLKQKNFFDLSIEKQTFINKSFAEFQLSVNDLSTIDQLIDGFIQVSFGRIEFSDKKIQTWLERKKESKLPYFVLSEYGERSGSHPMDITGNGIRLVEAFQGDITLQKRMDVLFSLSSKAFLKSLLLKDDVSTKTIQDYMNSRILFPGFLQNELPATLFILIQTELYLEQLKSGKLSGLDFHLPAQTLNQKVLAELFLECGLKANDWCIIGDKELSEKRAVKVRIFTNYLNDEDYKKLYYFSASSAGCSGDDTATTVLSTTNLPFYANYIHPIKSNFVYDVIKYFGKIQCPTLEQYMDLFDKDIVYTAHTNERQNTSLKFHMYFSIHFDMQNGKGDYLQDVTYLTFQKDLIKLYAKRIGQFVRLNTDKIEAELKEMHKVIYENANIFSLLPSLVHPIVENALSNKPKEPGLILNLPQKTDYEEERDFEIQTQVSSVEFLKNALNTLLPSEKPEFQWQFNRERDRFWLKVQDIKKEPYKKLFKDHRIDPKKIKGEEGYVVFATSELIADVTAVATETLQKAYDKKQYTF